MTRNLNRFFALSLAMVATLAVQGTMLAGFDNLAHAGQLESQARAAATACTAANTHGLEAGTHHAG